MMFRIEQSDDGRWMLLVDGAEHSRHDTPGEAGAAADRLAVALIAAGQPPPQMHWSGTIVLERVANPTGDGRAAEANAWTWETPFPFTWDREHGVHGGQVIGTVWQVEREGDQIRGAGTFDLGSELGRDAARHVAEGLTTDVSIEPDSVDVEVRVRAEVIADWEDELDALDDNEIETETDEPDEDGRVVLDVYRHDDFLEVVTAGRIRTLALVTTAAFDEATIGLADGVTLEALLDGTFDQPTDDAEGEPAEEPADDEMAARTPVAVVASGVPPQAPPVGWFDDPTDLLGPYRSTVPTVTADGRVYGYIAPWNSCHTSFPEVCTQAPRGGDYTVFHSHDVTLDDGSVVAAGVLSYGGGHADTRLGWRAALEHYDDVATGVAFVRVGENEHGLWAAGVLADGVDPWAVRGFEASPLSGDWRPYGGRLTLIAACSVNVPGFARVAAGAPEQVAEDCGCDVAGPRWSVVDGRQTALVAAGLHIPPQPAPRPSGRDTSGTLERMAARQMRDEVAPVRRARAASLRASLNR